MVVRPKGTCSTESNFFLTLADTLVSWPKRRPKAMIYIAKRSNLVPEYTQLDRY